MARFLHVVHPFRGHTLPLQAIACELADRGHEAAITTAPPISADLRAPGVRQYSFVRLQRFFAGIDAHSRGLASPFEASCWWLAEHAGARSLRAEVDDVADMIASFRPDFLVYDEWLEGSSLILPERLGLPFALVGVTLFSCFLPPGAASLVPPGVSGTHPERLLDWATWSSVVAGKRCLMGRKADRLRRRLGMGPLAESVDSYYKRRSLFLSAGLPELEDRRVELPPSVHYVPGVDLQPGLGVSSGATAGKATESVEGVLPEADGSPLVCVSVGTVHSHAGLRDRFVDSCLDLLVRLPVRAVVTIGDHDFEPRPLPSRIRVTRWLPYGELYRHADVVISNGGRGTVLRALEAGVPVLIVPVQADQAENSWRLQDAGVGLRVPLAFASSSRLQSALSRLLGERSFRDRARWLGERIGVHGGAVRAADLLESHLKLAGSPESARAVGASA